VSNISINSNIFFSQYDLKQATYNSFPAIPGLHYTITGDQIIKSNSFGADVYASAPLGDGLAVMAGASYAYEHTDPMAFIESIDGQGYKFTPSPFAPLIYTERGQTNPYLSMFLDAHSSTNQSVYSQLEYTPVKMLKLIGAARLNNNEEYGSNLVPRLAAICAVNDSLTVKALYGSAFRNPISMEKYADVTGTMMGNKDLKPEQINSTELAADWRLASTVLRLSAFQFVTDKIIDLNPATKTYENGEGQTIQGAEFEVKGALQEKGLRYDANISVKNGTNAKNDTDISFLDTFSGNVMLNHTAGRFNNSIVVKYIGERKGTKKNGSEVNVPALNTTDYKLSCKLLNDLELSLTIMNVFQQGIKYPELNGYMDYMPGESSRNYFAKAAYSF
jgi:iron complex outermembrane receptor protein